MPPKTNSSESHYDGKGGYRDPTELLRKEMEGSHHFVKGENAYRPKQDPSPQHLAPADPSLDDMKDNKIYQEYRANSKLGAGGESQSGSPGEWEHVRKTQGPSSIAGATKGSNDDDAGVDPGAGASTPILSPIKVVETSPDQTQTELLEAKRGGDGK